MISLDSYIQNAQFDPTEGYYKNHGEKVLNGYLSTQMQEKCKSDSWFSPIDEALTSHNSEELADRIQKEFGNIYNISDMCCIGGNDMQRCSIGIMLPKNSNIESDKQFKNLINIFGYTIRQHNQKDDCDFVILEPTYPHNDNGFIMNRCNGWCYHFTTQDRANRIINSGLRPRGSFSKNKNYPERIYVYANRQLYIDKLSKHEQNELIGSIFQIVGKHNIKRKGLAILRINLNKPNTFVGDFYEDTLMPLPGCYFTYYPIEKERIKQVHCPELESLVSQCV